MYESPVVHCGAPRARWFAKSLMQYVTSEAFAPKHEMTPQQLRHVFEASSESME
ncbi:MAG: hypothetical protein LUC50_07055 [Ruminococcus sp.]|nr:hypothetical protein [Ruminococcus sp.]